MWSTCTAIDPPLAIEDTRGLDSACGAHAPYTAHLRPLPGDPVHEDCHVWFCAEHAARFRADPRAVERLVQLRTTAPGSAHRTLHDTTDRSTERP